MPRFDADVLLEFATETLHALGGSRSDARLVASHLIEANLAGHDSHGLIRLPPYAADARAGNVHPDRQPTVEREGPTTALVDGHFAWGPVTARRAVEIATEKARSHALGAVAVRNCYHVGRVGAYLLEAVKEGFVAQAFCNGHGMRRAAPWGGTEARLATNPFAVAVPTRDQPIVVDFATTTVAEGKIRLAKAKGQTIPEGWVMDSEGRPTTDPNVLYTGGTLVPLGGREGHKGYCLSVAMDLLAGMLSGAGAGLTCASYGNGMFINVVDPRAFDSEEAFYDRLEGYVAYLKSSPARPGVEEILLPGDPERRTEARRRREGVEIDEDTWEKITTLARELGVAHPG